MGILRTRVRPGFAEVEIFFVSESLARRTIGNPILLVLIQMKQAFQNRDHKAESYRYPPFPGNTLQVQGREEGNERRGCDLCDLDPLEYLLIAHAFRSYHDIWSSSRSMIGSASGMCLTPVFNTTNVYGIG